METNGSVVADAKSVVNFQQFFQNSKHHVNFRLAPEQSHTSPRAIVYSTLPLQMQLRCVLWTLLSSNVMDESGLLVAWRTVVARRLYLADLNVGWWGLWCGLVFQEPVLSVLSH